MWRSMKRRRPLMASLQEAMETMVWRSAERRWRDHLASRI
jgi:predicted mannosyl-3-phosphoglycerate phosphatase (HAD superfamily)